MRTRSRIPADFVLQEVPKVIRADWPTFTSLVGLQVDKEFFNLRRMFQREEGKGDNVRQVSLRITDLCNLRCHTCGQWGDNGYLIGKPPKELKKNEVPVAVYKQLVDQIVEAGWSPVWYIWGGEPMLYQDLFELLYYIAERKMPIMMVSNGTNIAKYAKEIADTCKVLWLSLDGHNEEIHNQQRPGVSDKMNNFRDVERALAAVEEEKQRRGSHFPYLAPISVVARYNINHLLDIYKFSRQYADMHIYYLSWWIDEQSAHEHTKDFEHRFGFAPHTHLGWIGTWKDFDHHLILEQFDEMRRLMRERTNGYKKCVPFMYPHLKTEEDIQRYYEDHRATFGYEQCISIFMTMEIDSNGDVSLCRDYHDYVIGNIQTEGVQEMWNNEAAKKFRKSLHTEGLMPVCRRCCGLMGY
jgi:radical SAM protein with 4Fe4S-binding SPASM domain